MASKYVWVACKLPNGIVLELPGHSTKYRLNGGRIPRDQDGNFVVDRPTPGGCGLTMVPGEFWEAWLAHHADPSRPGHYTFAPLEGGFIFAQPSMDSASDAAKERAEDLKTPFTDGMPQKPTVAKDGVTAVDAKDLPAS